MRNTPFPQFGSDALLPAAFGCSPPAVESPCASADALSIVALLPGPLTLCALSNLPDARLVACRTLPVIVVVHPRDGGFRFRVSTFDYPRTPIVRGLFRQRRERFLPGGALVLGCRFAPQAVRLFRDGFLHVNLPCAVRRRSSGCPFRSSAFMRYRVACTEPLSPRLY